MRDRESELIYLKFKKRFSTLTLLKRFPWEKKRIAEIALLDVNRDMRTELIASRKIKIHLRALERKLRKIQRAHHVIPFLILFVSGTALADVQNIHGTILTVDSDDKAIGVIRPNSKTQMDEMLKVTVDETTKYRGAYSLNDLETGDEVQVRASWDNFSQTWEADLLRKV